MKKAEWFEKREDGFICTLCPGGCAFESDGTSRGLCRVRGVKDGEPFLPEYGECVSLSIDPIEKKPLYHFLPGSQILSTGPAGCNLRCDFCQNWSISQGSAPTRFVPPEELADLALSRGSCGVAFTYTEPIIWYEYIADVAPLVRDRGGAVVMVSNGEINSEPLRKMTTFTDAWNVDLKSWSGGFYEKHCRGDRQTVLNTLRVLGGSDCHLEITFLIIPGENDNPEEWREMAEWIADSCGRDTVLHISRYFPRYKLKAPPTPVKTLLEARGVFSEVLHHVFIGNASTDFSNTLCPSCGEVCINRNGYSIDADGLREGKCSSCGADPGVVHEL